MLFKFTAKATNGSSVKEIEKLAAKLADAQKLNTAVGKGFATTLQKHFKKLNKRPNKRKWHRLGFWNGIAKATYFLSADANKATVSIGGVEGAKFAAKVFSARIKPKSGKKFLAIPAIESRYGVSPSALDDGDKLEFRRTRKGGLLGEIRAVGSMNVHYWLVKQADVPRDNDALPKMSDISADVKKSISKYLKIK